MLHEEEPRGFNPKFEAAGCLVENDGRILLLLRRDDKPEGSTWGLPSGTVESGETPVSAMLRELEEETGIRIQGPSMSYYRKVFVRYPEYDFLYHIFHVKLEGKGNVRINPDEHVGFKWVDPAEASGLPLIQDLDSCIRMFFSI
ncbi:MAG: NUDIX hydrolase [Candidatus Aenigmarchaeota archaeon]|nr:NUDIX hydrolase [Candidatus Aenigmarchaeota archaeon]